MPFVDDEAVMRHAVTQWLAFSGFEVVIPDTAEAALCVLTKQFPGTDLLRYPTFPVLIALFSRRSPKPIGEHTAEASQTNDVSA